MITWWEPTDGRLEEEAMSDHFITEFGHRIDFVPKHYETMLSGFAGSVLDDHYTKPSSKRLFRADDWSQQQVFELSYLKTLTVFSYLAWFLNRWGRLQIWDNAIDLGGAHGTLSALLKSSGLAKRATSVDIADYSNISADFDAFCRQATTVAASAGQRLQAAKDVLDFFPNQEPLVGIWHDFPSSAAVDEFQHGDLFAVTGKYDLVTSFATLDLFDLDRVCAKVRDLLTDDGLFVCIEEYWWWTINSSCIVGHFPYAMQRLTRSDLQRYVAEHHPSLLPSLDARWRFLYDGTCPTISDWIAAADRHGLRLVGIDRVMAKRHHRLPFLARTMLRDSAFNLQEIIRDIRHFRPDVAVDDLLTSISTIALEKA